MKDEFDLFNFNENDFENEIEIELDDDGINPNDFANELDDETTTQPVFKPKRDVPKVVKFKNAAALSKIIPSQPKERYYTIVDGSFIFGDFIYNFIVDRDFVVENLTIATLSMSLENIMALSELMKKGYVKNLNIIVSDFFFSHERNKLIKNLYEACNFEGRFQLSVCRSHCKICLIEVSKITKTPVSLKYTIHGSANMRASDNLEQFSIEEGFEMYDFNFDYFCKVIDRFKTVNKSIKTKELIKLGTDG